LGQFFLTKKKNLSHDATLGHTSKVTNQHNATPSNYYIWVFYLSHLISRVYTENIFFEQTKMKLIY
jgi:hypothetical protein